MLGPVIVPCIYIPIRVCLCIWSSIIAASRGPQIEFAACWEIRDVYVDNIFTTEVLGFAPRIDYRSAQ